MLKTIIKKFLQSKFASFVITALSGWRIWLLVSSIIGGYIWNSNRKLNNANKSIVSLTIELQLSKLSVSAYQLTQDTLLVANKQCADNNRVNQANSVQAQSKLSKKIKDINDEYKKLKDKKIISECGNTVITDDVL